MRKKEGLKQVQARWRCCPQSPNPRKRVLSLLKAFFLSTGMAVQRVVRPKQNDFYALGHVPYRLQEAYCQEAY